MTRPAKTFELLHESHVNNFWWFGRWCFRSKLTVIQFLTVRLGWVCSRNFIAQQFPQWTISIAFEHLNATSLEPPCFMLEYVTWFSFFSVVIFAIQDLDGFGWIWTYQSETCTGLQSRKLAEVIFTFFHLEARGNCCFELALAEAKMQVVEASRKGCHTTKKTKPACN